MIRQCVTCRREFDSRKRKAVCPTCQAKRQGEPYQEPPKAQTPPERQETAPTTTPAKPRKAPPPPPLPVVKCDHCGRSRNHAAIPWAPMPPLDILPVRTIQGRHESWCNLCRIWDRTGAEPIEEHTQETSQ